MGSDSANTICGNERKNKKIDWETLRAGVLTRTSARGLRQKPVYDLLAYVTSDSLARFLFCASFAVLPIVCRMSSTTVRAMPPQKKPKVEKGQRFLTGFKGSEKDAAGNESASVGISEDSDHSQSESALPHRLKPWVKATCQRLPRNQK